MSASGSQSSDGGQKSQVSIHFTMHRGSLKPDTVMGTFHLEMPLGGMISRFKQNEYPLVLLEIKDEDQMECLLRMKKLQHENILGMHFYDGATVGSGARCIRAYIEPYTGYLSNLFHPLFLVNIETNLIPSQPFQEIVSVSLDALDYIIRSDCYHGNFSWRTTFYHKDKDGTKTLKLSNFEKKNHSLVECQVGDCHALAHGLEEVSLHVRTNYADCQPETCVLIDDLARRLRAVTAESLSLVKQENEDHPFFWDGKRKRTFYAYDIPAAWDKPAFLESFEGSPSAPAMPWNTSWENDSFLPEMEIYRAANGIKEYNFNELKDFIRFISGLYTHEMELKKKVNDNLDIAVHGKHPHLLIDLKVATEAAN